jgi:hypothetical protein
MALSTDNIHSFDDCSILHQANIKIPKGFRKFFDYDYLHHKNFNVLRNLSENLKKRGIKKYRFVPSNIETNIIKVGNMLLSKCGNVSILSITFKSKVLMQLKEFIDLTTNEYEEIIKDDDIGKIKEIFEDNKRELIKERNIPEDDDLKIISGYHKYKCSGYKYLISGDEHFWGYTGLILTEFKIQIVKEWECHLINVIS